MGTAGNHLHRTNAQNDPENAQPAARFSAHCHRTVTAPSQAPRRNARSAGAFLSAESIAKALTDPADEPEEVIAIAAGRVDVRGG